MMVRRVIVCGISVCDYHICGSSSCSAYDGYGNRIPGRTCQRGLRWFRQAARDAGRR